jgi:hypothetical protein
MRLQPHLPRHPPRTAFVSTPMCLDCTKRMQLVSVVQHARFTNLDVREFKCDVCASTTSEVVARVDTQP